MSNNISFTIPLEVSVLERVAALLRNMSHDLSTDINRDQDTTPKINYEGQDTLVAGINEDDDNVDQHLDIADVDEVDTCYVAVDAEDNTGDDLTRAARLLRNMSQDDGDEDNVNDTYNFIAAHAYTEGEDDVDSAGLPWDKRINSDSKLKTKKEGLWKLRRKIDLTYVAKIHAELRAAKDSSVVTTAPPPPPPPPDTSINFAKFMEMITSALATQKITELDVATACQTNNLATITLVSQNPDRIIPILTALNL